MLSLPLSNLLRVCGTIQTGEFMGKYLEELTKLEFSKESYFLLHPRAAEKPRIFLKMYGSTNPQNPQNSSLSCGTGAPPDALEASRLGLCRLEGILGSADVCRAIWRTSRRLEREQGAFWRLLDASERHILAVCVALSDAEF